MALLAWPLARRLRDTEATVRRQQVDLANLAQLSQYIVQNLRESIVVVDHENRIRLINESAAALLGDSGAYPGALLGEASPQLLYLLETWRQHAGNPAAPTQTFVAADGGRVIQPHFAPLGGAEPSPVIVFLEDTELLAAKIQQSKLAGLGRLSASIAHEIRNPVGAMSHAAQLLAESSSLSAEDKRLTEIVRTNGDRVRQIIENVMSMARRENSRPERLVLATWLAGFRDEFCATMQIAPARLAISSLLGDVEIQVDPSQLRQIVWNLCENAVKYGVSKRRQRHHRAARGPARLHGAALPRSGRSRTGHRRRSIASGSSSRFSRATSAAPASGCSWRASWRRPTAPHFYMSRAPAAAACSASCSAIRNAGWRDLGRGISHGATARTRRR